MKKLFFMCCTMFILTLSAQTSTIVDDQVDQVQVEEQNVTVNTVMQNVNVVTDNLQTSSNIILQSSRDFLDDVYSQVNPYVVDLNNNITQVTNVVNNNINNTNTTDLISLLVDHSKSQYSSIMERKGID